MMENEQQIPESVEQPVLDSWQREERCRKSIKTVSKAMFMRLVVTGLLIWVLFQTSMEPWIIGMIVLVLLINLTGILPLFSEWKKQRRLLKEIIAEDET